MPVPAPNPYPEFNVIRLSQLCLNVKDLVASQRFYVDTLGLQVSDENEKHVYLRAMGERGHHCLILQKSAAPGTIDVLGLKTFGNTSLDRAKTNFKSKGQPTEWVKRPYQDRALLTSYNVGIPIEFFHEMDRLAPIHQNCSLHTGVKPLRTDHLNCFSKNVDASVAFNSDFCFRVTEYTEDKDSKRIWAAWLHLKGGVHDLALTNGAGPRLNHLAFCCPTPFNIIDLMDLMATTGHVKNIERGPRQHGIPNTFFLYISDPDVHRTEIYCSDYETVDPDL